MQILTRPRPYRKGALVGLVRAGGAVQGRVVVEGASRVFERGVRFDRHYFRLDGGWSLSGTILRELQRLRVQVIRYCDDVGGTWEISFAAFVRLAKRRIYPTRQGGVELQFILPLHAWQHTAPAAAPQQLNLLREVAAP